MIRIQSCENEAAWDAYIEANPRASNYHRWKWRDAIRDGFGHESFYLAATEGEAIRGVLPLVLVKSRIFGSSLVSMPFGSYGGVLADTDEICDELLRAAETLGRRLRVDRIELRQSEPIASNWQRSTHKVSMETPLPAVVDELWSSLSKNLRHNVSRGRTRGLQVEWADGAALDEFYEIFAANMRNLGTPVYSRRWFRSICARFPGEVRILLIRDEGKCVASGFVLPFRGTVELPWSASLPEARKKYAHVLLFWSVMEWAVQNGYQTVDLGRCTPGGGTYEFKRHWPCVEKPLGWYYWLPSGEPLPEVRPENPRYALAIGIWKRLPLPVANVIGPRIVRGIP